MSCALITDVVDEVWVLELPVEVAKQRLMNRNSLSEADVRRRRELISHETHLAKTDL